MLDTLMHDVRLLWQHKQWNLIYCVRPAIAMGQWASCREFLLCHLMKQNLGLDYHSWASSRSINVGPCNQCTHGTVLWIVRPCVKALLYQRTSHASNSYTSHCDPTFPSTANTHCLVHSEGSAHLHYLGLVSTPVITHGHIPIRELLVYCCTL